MYTLKAENAKGQIIELTHNPNYTIQSILGLDPGSANINTSQTATQDGSKFNSAKVPNRNIVITMTVNSPAEQNRNNLYRYFVLKQKVKLYFKNGIRNVYIEGRVEKFDCPPFSQTEVAQISIICNKPYWKAMEEIITEFDSVLSGFEFETEFPSEGIEFSTVLDEVRKTVLNSGGVETGLIIEITCSGTVVNPVIYDAITKEKMKINFTMHNADVITINTNPGEKSITLLRNGAESNLINKLGKDADWLKLSAGENIFTMDCDEGFDKMTVNIKQRDEFGGV